MVAIPDTRPSLRLPVPLDIAAIAETALSLVVVLLIDEQVLARMLLVQLLVAQVAIYRDAAWV